jgi:glutamate racemase
MTTRVEAPIGETAGGTSMSRGPRLDPIGVFDSGVGGLTVARALMRRLPNESIFYFGDTARVPYGIKSADAIKIYAREIVTFLLNHEVKLLIVACNTMAAVAAETIRGLSSVPVLDVIEAGAQAAVAATRNKKIGVIGTLATVGSGAYEAALRQRDAAVDIRTRACPLFVPLAEEGWLDHPATQLTAQEYLTPLVQAGIDTLVLGCTHYPLLKATLAKVAGPNVTLIDSAQTVAEQTAGLLQEKNLARPNGVSNHRFFVTDVPQRFQEIGERFLGQPLSSVEVVRW